MTLDDFRRMALSLPGVKELNGFGYPIFCIGRRRFATIEDLMAVLTLTRDQQARLVAAAPEVFQPVSSGWGLLGYTVISLEAADAATVHDALSLARSNVAESAGAGDAAAISNPAETPAIGDVGSGVKAELYGHLKSMIERVQAHEPTEGRAQGEETQAGREDYPPERPRPSRAMSRKSKFWRHLKEMNFISAHQSSSPVWSATQSSVGVA